MSKHTEEPAERQFQAHSLLQRRRDPEPGQQTAAAAGGVPDDRRTLRPGSDKRSRSLRVPHHPLQHQPHPLDPRDCDRPSALPGPSGRAVGKKCKGGSARCRPSFDPTNNPTKGKTMITIEPRRAGVSATTHVMRSRPVRRTIAAAFGYTLEQLGIEPYDTEAGIDWGMRIEERHSGGKAVAMFTVARCLADKLSPGWDSDLEPCPYGGAGKSAEWATLTALDAIQEAIELPIMYVREKRGEPERAPSGGYYLGSGELLGYELCEPYAGHHHGSPPDVRHRGRRLRGARPPGQRDHPRTVAKVPALRCGPRPD